MKTLTAFNYVIVNELHNPWNEDNQKFHECCDIVQEACKKADKYRWHDLRKNSDDLPNDFHTVLICINGFEGKAAGVSMAMHNSILKVWGTESHTYKDYEVIAWREIEPFEVKV